MQKLLAIRKITIQAVRDRPLNTRARPELVSEIPLTSLEVEDLKISINRKLLVEGISFSVGESERLCLLGASGSGKSVTACAILGQLPAHAELSGSVKIAGHEVLGVPLQRRPPEARAAMVFQDSAVALNPLIQVGQQLAEPFRRHQGMSKKTAAEASVQILEAIGMPTPEALMRSFPSQLSGGQRQRVCIALAVACRTRLLVADEPTTALDVVTQEKVLQVLRRYTSTEESPALLFITHDIAVAASICDTGVVIHNGKIIEHRPFNDLVQNPQHPFTRSLLAAAEASAVQMAITQTQRAKPGQERVLIAQGAPAPEAVSAPSSSVGTVLSQSYAQPLPAGVVEDCTAPAGTCNPEVDYLAAENISRTFPLPSERLFGRRQERLALNDVSIQIGKNECVGLVGSSGCGKTTFLRSLLALDTPDTGRITCDGKEIRPGSLKSLKWYRKIVQYVPQDPATSLDLRMSVRELLREPLTHLDVECDHEVSITEALDSVGLTSSLQSKKASELSGGQAQRVAIARALVVRPQFLLADEPVSGLDLPMREQIISLLQSLCRERGMGLLVVSHDISMVASLCERTVVIDAGQIIEDGETSDVLTNPRHQRTHDLLNAIPTLNFARPNCKEAAPPALSEIGKRS